MTSNIRNNSDKSLSTEKDSPRISEDEIAKLEKRLNDLQSEAQDIRKDFLTIFGLFASLVTFLTIEVQVFRTIPRYSLAAGLSFLLLASLLMFSLSIRNIFLNKVEWKDFIRPVFVGITFFLIASMICFYWAVHTPKSI